MIGLVGSVLLSSLLGSPHCAAMCGGFACFYATEPGTRSHRRALLAYHGGRLTSYVLLGVMAGMLGAGIDMAGRVGGVARPAAVLAGLLMVGWGTVSILRTAGVRFPRLPVLRASQGLLQRALQRSGDRSALLRGATLGLLTALLPCGWLYVFVATAGGSGSPWRGALVMAVFWLGTVPMLAGVGVVLQQLSGRFRRRLPLATAAVLVVIGLLTAAGRLGAGPGDSPSRHPIHDHR